MSTTETATEVVKFHVSLNASELKRSIAFYRVLFDVEPAKIRDDYAKFELDEPPVVVSLIPISSSSGGHVNHLGIRFRDSATLVAAQMRLEQVGIATQREEGVECCYSKQTKFWVNDPDGALWELYVLHADADENDEHSPSRRRGLSGDSTFRGEVATSARPMLPVLPVLQASQNTARSTARAEAVIYRHMLTQPLPDRIEHADASVDDVQLQGTLNMKLTVEQVRAFLQEARRVLRPGGTIEAHVLTSNRSLAERPVLPGPAALVEHVWTETQAAEFFVEAGFVGTRFVKLGDVPCFTLGDVQMRETKLAATNPSADACGQTVEVLYRGPLPELRDDYGNVLPRGRRVRIATSHAAQLASFPQIKECVSFGTGVTGGGGCG